MPTRHECLRCSPLDRQLTLLSLMNNILSFLPRHSKVGNFHDQILTHETVSGSQIPTHDADAGRHKHRFKDHRQRIPKKCYKTIFRKINTEEIFFQLTLITNKDYFSRKKINLRKFTVAVYVIYIYGRDVTHWCQL